MGGYGSGPWYRSRYRLVERSCTLSLADLKRAGCFDKTGRTSETIWMWRRDESVSATVRMVVAPSGREEYRYPHLIISYHWQQNNENRTGKWHEVRDAFDLCRTFPNYGGARWWVRCVCGRRVAKLYLPPGSTNFRCRNCHRLRYRTQRLTIDARWQNRANRIVRRLGGEADDGNVYKPKWMRWVTFHRLMDEVEDWNDAACGYRFRGLRRAIQARIGNRIS